MATVEQATSQTKKRGQSKTREGYVTSNKMQKTVVVSVVTKVRHPNYGKFVSRTKKYVAHDENAQCGIGDRVLIVESRPLSKTKRWRVQQVLAKAA